MRFVSKNSNLLVVLTPGLPAQPLSGTPAKAGLYVKFKGGVMETSDENIIKGLKAHPAFNNDFIAVEEKALDPFSSSREETEPVHHISEIKYGHVENPKSSNKKVKISKEMEKVINALAMEKVKELLPGMVEATIKQLAAASKKKEDNKEEVKSE